MIKTKLYQKISEFLVLNILYIVGFLVVVSLWVLGLWGLRALGFRGSGFWGWGLSTNSGSLHIVPDPLPFFCRNSQDGLLHSENYVYTQFSLFCCGPFSAV